MLLTKFLLDSHSISSNCYFKHQNPQEISIGILRKEKTLMLNTEDASAFY